MTSPISTSSMGISLSAPSRTTMAVFGASPISFLMASLVRPLDTASRDLPSRMSVMMTPARLKIQGFHGAEVPGRDLKHVVQTVDHGGGRADGDEGVHVRFAARAI